MEWLRSAMLPPQGSVFAGEVDDLYMFLFWLSVFLFLGIAVPAIYFAWRYRFKAGRVTPHQTHNTLLEILWSVIPLLLCVGIFFWGLDGWMKYSVAPGESMQIQILAHKWVWTFEYPDGTRTANEIHVLQNKPTQFVMTSDDVLHDFFVPDMRVKHDIVPGRYTQVWFTPTVHRAAYHYVRGILRQRAFGHACEIVCRYPGRIRQVPRNRRHGVGRLQDEAGRMGQDSI